MPKRKVRSPKTPSWGRVAVFAALALLIVGGAIFLLRPKELREDTSAVTPLPSGAARPYETAVRIDMEGFLPREIVVPAGQRIRLRLVNPDNAMHSDGGGWHQLAIPQLGVDAKVAPLTTKTIELPAAAAGEYAFYCDVCCGGKDNPSMQGKLVIRGS